MRAELDDEPGANIRDVAGTDMVEDEDGAFLGGELEDNEVEFDAAKESIGQALLVRLGLGEGEY